MTSQPLLVDWRDGRVTLVPAGASIPVRVRRIVTLQIEEDGPETLTVRSGLETTLGSFSIRLERGLRAITLDASIDADGALELRARELRAPSSDSLEGRFLALLEEESAKGHPWVEEYMVAERLGIPTRREMVLDEEWLETRDALLATGLVERRVHREPAPTGYIERRQLALGRRVAGTEVEGATFQASLPLAEEVPELGAAPSAIELSPSVAPIGDSLRSVVFWLVLGALVLFALARAWS